ncbi:MAG: THUMP domain-containing protein [Cyclobacteriaceae bacterium]|nr:THUMP domain-containing protein [Cyclobacteriaceae bacterium]
MKITIKTLHGLEAVLAREVESLGGDNIKVANRAVHCEGNLAFLYKVNYQLRTALKVLVPVHTFTARNDQQLYDQIKAFDWSQYLEKHQTFAIDSTIFSEYFKHTKFAALKMKDAVVDQFRDKYGQRPSIDTDSPDVLLNLHGYQDQFTVSLDSSGESLNRRGYRGKGHDAPLNEVLAAGMLGLSGWDPSLPLIDPFCGTGTLLIEAAMMAMGLPPQTLRETFGFKTWKSFQPMIWTRVKADAHAQVRKKSLMISGGDIDPKAISMARQSLKSLKIRDMVTLREISFEKHFPKTRSGFVITNPPYGERIGTNVESLYEAFGDTLKQHYAGFDAWIISSNKPALRKIGLKDSQRIELYNGKLDCEFCKYDLYAGAKED